MSHQDEYDRKVAEKGAAMALTIVGCVSLFLALLLSCTGPSSSSPFYQLANYAVGFLTLGGMSMLCGLGTKPSQ